MDISIIEKFNKNIKTLNLTLDKHQIDQLITYKNLIQETNKVLNLTGIDDDEGIFVKHFYDSLLISPMIPAKASLVDVGSGAGFPGVVLAIARPDINVTCIEPIRKRTNFLDEVKEKCGLNNLTILNARAEDVIDEYRESFDVASARAVAYLDILAELCMPFVKKGGSFIAMKGSKGIEEYEESKKAITILGGGEAKFYGDNYDELGNRYNIVIDKINKTPQKYPRSYAKIKKMPLSGRNV